MEGSENLRRYSIIWRLQSETNKNLFKSDNLNTNKILKLMSIYSDKYDLRHFLQGTLGKYTIFISTDINRYNDSLVNPEINNSNSDKSNC